TDARRSCAGGDRPIAWTGRRSRGTAERIQEVPPGQRSAPALQGACRGGAGRPSLVSCCGASKFDLDLDEVAQSNQEKCRDRWGDGSDGQRASADVSSRVLDAAFPEHERLPRQFEAELTTVTEGSSVKMRAFVNGRQMGQDLTDNAHSGDGYRFH